MRNYNAEYQDRYGNTIETEKFEAHNIKEARLMAGMYKRHSSTIRTHTRVKTIVTPIKP